MSKSTERTAIIRIGLLVFTIVTTSGCAHECFLETGDVAATEESRISALQTRDVDMLRQIYLDDAILVHATGRVEPAGDFVQRLEDGSLSVVRVEDLAETRIRRLAGVVAVFGSRAMTVVISSDTSEFRYRFSSVYGADSECRPRLVHWGAWSIRDDP